MFRKLAAILAATGLAVGLTLTAGSALAAPAHRPSALVRALDARMVADGIRPLNAMDGNQQIAFPQTNTSQYLRITAAGLLITRGTYSTNFRYEPTTGYIHDDQTGLCLEYDHGAGDFIEGGCQSLPRFIWGFGSDAPFSEMLNDYAWVSFNECPTYVGPGAQVEPYTCQGSGTQPDRWQWIDN